MPLSVLAVPSFTRVFKKLHEKDKAAIKQAIAAVAQDPAQGQEKKGDLAGLFVYKFKLNNQETVLGYRLQPSKTAPEELVLIAIGPHENFYAGVKR
jgi:mRNA-degrading endonuclease RelE of RelBE toxin-antitoxin system